MHNKKTELIAELRKEYAGRIKALRKTTDALFGMGFKMYTLWVKDDGVAFRKDVKSLEEMYKILHKARRILPFDLDSYWIPYSRCVCIRYVSKINPAQLLFSVTGNEEAIIKQFSSGKCRVGTCESSIVVCDVK